MPSITAKPTLGHCEFCNAHLAIVVAFSGQLLVPFGECHDCRRFTVWHAVDVTALAPEANDLSVRAHE